MTKLWQIMLSSLFLAAITIPPVIMVFGPEKSVSMVEKRKLAPRPVLGPGLQQVAKFPAGCEAYVNDHFGFRELLVRLYDELFVSIFGSSPRSAVIVGKDKWLFIAAGHVLEDFLGQQQVSVNTLRQWKNVLREREEWLEEQGIYYLFTIPPSKMNVYPEYLPERIASRSGPTGLRQLVDFLDQEPRFTSFLDLSPVLLKAKQKRQIYLKGDTHWNFEGSYAAYKAIMTRLSEKFPELHPVPRKAMVREEKMLEGDLALTLNLGELYREKTSILWPPNHQKQIRYQHFSGYPQPSTEFQSFRKGDLYFNENPQAGNDLTAIFISDSFGSALRGYLTSHFKRIVFVRDARFEDMKLLIEKEQPDVVIDLNVARGMEVALGRNLEIHDYIRKKHHGKTRTVLAVTGNRLPEFFSGTVQLEVRKTIGTAVNLEAVGPDPQFLLSLGKEMTTAPLLLSCTLSSPTNTVFRLFYRGQGDSGYSGEQMLSQTLRRGKNSFVLKLYKSIDLSSLRLDPGETTGTYVLHSLKIEVEDDGF